MKIILPLLVLLSLPGCATVGPVTGAAARARVTSQNSASLKIESVGLHTVDGRTAISGWVRSRSFTLPPPSHVDVSLFNADRQEIAHQSVPIRLQRRRHSAPGPDRFTVVLDPWPSDAVEILVTPHTGAKHDSVAAN